MNNKIKVIGNGNVCSPKGFTSGSIFSGIKSPGQDKKDIGIIFSEIPCISAGTFTQNSIVSPSVSWTRNIINSGNVQAIVQILAVLIPQ